MIPPAVLFDEAHALKCDLAAEVLRSSGQLRLRVRGSSMLPSVWPGDMLMIERVQASAASVGDLLLCERDRRLFVHRVVSLGRTVDGTILTRGDAMPDADPAVPYRDILGRVSFIVRDRKLIVPKKILGLPQRAVATLIQRSEIAMRIAISVHRRLQSMRRRNPNHRVVPCQS
jgi:signal peptidase I